MRHLIFSIILLGCLAIFISGCATPYQSKGYRGGYTSLQLSNHVFRVSFSGNHHTSKQTVQRYLLRRCAEVCIKNGYSHFIIGSGNTAISKQYFYNSLSSCNDGNFGVISSKKEYSTSCKIYCHNQPNKPGLVAKNILAQFTKEQ